MPDIASAAASRQLERLDSQEGDFCWTRFTGAGAQWLLTWHESLTVGVQWLARPTSSNCTATYQQRLRYAAL
jgi:hypothetical protein